MNSSHAMERRQTAAGWTKAVGGTWAVLCVVAAVVLGPAATTASALDEANQAPPRHPVRADQAQAYLPAGPTRRR